MISTNLFCFENFSIWSNLAIVEERHVLIMILTHVTASDFAYFLCISLGPESQKSFRFPTSSKFRCFCIALEYDEHESSGSILEQRASVGLFKGSLISLQLRTKQLRK